MRSSQSSTIVSVEELEEMYIVPEMGISVEFGVTTIDSSSTMFISTEEMDESMLNLFGTSSEIHELIVSFGPSLSVRKLTSPLPVGHST